MSIFWAGNTKQPKNRNFLERVCFTIVWLVGAMSKSTHTHKYAKASCTFTADFYYKLGNLLSF